MKNDKKDFKYAEGPIEFLNEAKEVYGLYNFKNIPDHLITHGSVKVCNSRDIKIIGTHGKFYIIKYESGINGGSYTTLGFLEKDLQSIPGTIFRKDPVIDNYSII